MTHNFKTKTQNPSQRTTWSTMTCKSQNTTDEEYHGRIPLALQAVFLASNGGQDIATIKPPSNNVACRVFYGIFGSRKGSHASKISNTRTKDSQHKKTKHASTKDSQSEKSEISKRSRRTSLRVSRSKICLFVVLGRTLSHPIISSSFTPFATISHSCRRLRHSLSCRLCQLNPLKPSWTRG
jgi:hypothetical protein